MAFSLNCSLRCLYVSPSCVMKHSRMLFGSWITMKKLLRWEVKSYSRTHILGFLGYLPPMSQEAIPCIEPLPWPAVDNWHNRQENNSNGKDGKENDMIYSSNVRFEFLSDASLIKAYLLQCIGKVTINQRIRFLQGFDFICGWRPYPVTRHASDQNKRSAFFKTYYVLFADSEYYLIGNIYNAVGYCSEGNVVFWCIWNKCCSSKLCRHI